MFARSTVFLAALAAASPVFADVVVVKSTFDTGLEGWADPISPDTVKWHATGGNPGGVVALSDTTNHYTELHAPAAFLYPAVNYSALNGKGYISYQQKIGMQSDIISTTNYTVVISGRHNTAIFQGAQAPFQSPWITATAPLIQGDWTMTEGTWAGLMEQVTYLSIQLELVHNKHFNEDSEFIDNIEIVSHPSGFSP